MPSTPNYQNEGIPYITSKNIRNGIVMFDDVKYITEEDYKTISNNRPITENDFLISMIGTIGEVDLTKVAARIVARTYEPFVPYIFIALIYLVVVVVLTQLLKLLERRLAKSDRK